MDNEKELTHIDLFSGIGGFTLAAEWAGFKAVVFCEKEKFCQKVLKKHWPEVPIIPDIKDFLDYWGIDICEAKNKKSQICRISNSHKRPRKEEELSLSVKIVKQKNLFPQALQKEEENIVHGNVSVNLCEEEMEQTLAVANGCKGKKTQIGNMAKDMKDNVDINKQRLINGEDEFLPEINTLVKNVEKNQRRKINLGHTISKNGQNIQNCDSHYQMESLSASSVIIKSTEGMKIDLLTAGVPCQPASIAGKRGGKTDARWLWPETLEVIQHIKPTWCLLENVIGILSLEGGMEFENVCIALEKCGYEVQTFIIPACGLNAPHRRNRVWIVANTKINNAEQYKTRNTERERKVISKDGIRLWDKLSGPNSDASNTKGKLSRKQAEQKRRENSSRRNQVDKYSDSLNAQRSREQSNSEDSLGLYDRENSAWQENWYEIATRFCGMAHGISDRTHRLKALGNAIVPQIAYEILKNIAWIEKQNN